MFAFYMSHAGIVMFIIRLFIAPNFWLKHFSAWDNIQSGASKLNPM